jgi:glycogen phosphorylase
MRGARAAMAAVDDLKQKFPNLPERLAGLGELAFNLWWSWHPAARILFKRLHREAWKDSFYNPVKLLMILPKEVLADAAGDPKYLRHYDFVLDQFHRDLGAQVCWFTENITGAECYPIAYFSLEYGVHRSLPFYAGGLGFLAGDHLKECSDLGIPVVGMGFMYPDGYVRQKLDANGWQQGEDEILDRDSAPITRVFDEHGKHLVVQVPVCEPPIYVSVWQAKVGRVPLYLMDTGLEQNEPEFRRISDHLYISDLEQRLLQEIVLGLGGTEVLSALNIKHSVLHLNEGHPAFALLERLRERLEEGGMSYEAAVREVRATSVFTTHTPVPAGLDVFPYELMDTYFSRYWPRLGLDRDAFYDLGRDPQNPGGGFNMTAFALRLSAYHNAVSRKHGEVSRRMWQPLWPDKEVEQVPIDAITNGVHVPTWINPKVELLFNKYLGSNWLEDHDNPAVWEMLDEIPDQELWAVHTGLRVKLIDRIRERARRRWSGDLGQCCNVVAGGAMLDPTILTIGFARRFATYKRAELIFSDLDRLKRILNDPWQPVQVIFAGKAHPADDPGKEILQRIFNHCRDPQLAGRVAFVEDYGEQLAQYLVHGVDVWLNNPLPPLEACGTSGMKATLNGVPHLSILDGWWPEGFKGANGWAFGDEAAENMDAKDAEAIYNILEHKVVPLFYKTDDNGVPRGWVQFMKAAIKNTAAPFSARRMVKEYSQKCYQEALKGATK